MLTIEDYGTNGYVVRDTERTFKARCTSLAQVQEVIAHYFTQQHDTATCLLCAAGYDEKRLLGRHVVA